VKATIAVRVDQLAHSSTEGILCVEVTSPHLREFASNWWVGRRPSTLPSRCAASNLMHGLPGGSPIGGRSTLAQVGMLIRAIGRASQLHSTC